MTAITPSALRSPRTSSRSTRSTTAQLIGRDEELAPWPRTPEIVRQHLADYYAAIEFLDAQIGRILDALKASNQYENTLIVFTADHGLAIGSHGLFGKQNLYDHSMRAPLDHRRTGHPAGPASRRDVLPARHLPDAGRTRRHPGARGERGPEPRPDPRPGDGKRAETRSSPPMPTSSVPSATTAGSSSSIPRSTRPNSSTSRTTPPSCTTSRMTRTGPARSSASPACSDNGKNDWTTLQPLSSAKPLPPEFKFPTEAKSPKPTTGS